MSVDQSASIISIQGLRKSYDDHVVLKGVGLTVEEGELFSLIGASGCGKSTFLRCLNGLETMDSGHIHIDGIEMGWEEGKKPTPEKIFQMSHQIRKKVGMVFQGFNLFPHMTLLENVMIAPMIVQSATKEDARKNAMRLLNKVGLEAFAARSPVHLSGGQQQRGAIARALAMNPRVMLYDEPTSALDPEMVGEVLAVMKEIDQEGMTQIVVTHEISFARDASDYIVYMEEGEIIEISDEDEIFINPKDPRTARFLKKFMQTS